MLVTELSFADLWAKKNDHLISSSGTIHYPNRKHEIRFLPYIINTNKKLKKILCLLIRLFLCPSIIREAFLIRWEMENIKEKIVKIESFTI